MQDDFDKFINSYDLRILHSGGDYGTFLTWALGWLDHKEYQDIQQLHTEAAGFYYHMDNYINRDYDSGTVRLTVNDNHATSIVRLHYNINDIENDILAIADTGPTILIDPTNCILEMLNNRETKMLQQASWSKIENIQELASQIQTWLNVFDKCRNLQHENLYIVKMKQLVKKPAITIKQAYQWWRKHHGVRSNDEINDAIAYWQSKQKFLNHDENILALLRSNDPLLTQNIPSILKSRLCNTAQQLSSKTDIDDLVYNQCLQKLSSDCPEYKNLVKKPKVSNMYPAVLHVAKNINKQLVESYKQVVDRNLSSCIIVIHNTEQGGQSLVNILNSITSHTEDLFYELSIDKLSLQPFNEWIGFLRTRAKKIIILDRKNFELEHALRISECTASADINKVFSSPGNSTVFDNVYDRDNTKKILLKDLVDSFEETIRLLCNWTQTEITKPICATEYFTNNKYNSIDQEYNKIHGGFSYYAKYKKATEYLQS